MCISFFLKKMRLRCDRTSHGSRLSERAFWPWPFWPPVPSRPKLHHHRPEPFGILSGPSGRTNSTPPFIVDLVMQFEGSEWKLWIFYPSGIIAGGTEGAFTATQTTLSTQSQRNHDFESFNWYPSTGSNTFELSFPTSNSIRIKDNSSSGCDQTFPKTTDYAADTSMVGTGSGGSDYPADSTYRLVLEVDEVDGDFALQHLDRTDTFLESFSGSSWRRQEGYLMLDIDRIHQPPSSPQTVETKAYLRKVSPTQIESSKTTWSSSRNSNTPSAGPQGDPIS